MIAFQRFLWCFFLWVWLRQSNNTGFSIGLTSVAVASTVLTSILLASTEVTCPRDEMEKLFAWNDISPDQFARLTKTKQNNDERKPLYLREIVTSIWCQDEFLRCDADRYCFPSTVFSINLCNVLADCLFEPKSSGSPPPVSVFWRSCHR